MKKVTLVAIATLTLFIAGCSQQKTATEPSQEQETEQVETKQSSSKKETKSKGLDVDVKDAPTSLTGNEDYMGVIAYKFQKELGFKNGTVFYYEGNLAVALNLSRDYLEKAEAQDLVNSIYDLKVAVLNQYNADHNSYKRVQITVYDNEAKKIAHEENASMVLDY